MSQRRQAIAKDVLMYSGSFVFINILNTFTALFVRYWLGPTQMGVWVVLQIILNYSKYTNMGIGRAATRDIPYYKGQQNMARVDLIRNTSFSFILSSSTLLTLLIIIVTIVFRDRMTPLVFYSSLTVSLASILQRITNFCIAILRAERNFQFASKYNIYSTIVSTAFTVILIVQFKLYGYYISILLALFFNLIYILVRSNIPFRLQMDIPTLKVLFKDGIPLLVINIIRQFLFSLDKIAVGFFLGVRSLGIYSIVMMVNNMIYMFPNVIGMVVWPYLNEEYGTESKKNARTSKYLTYPTLFTVIYLPLLIGVIWLTGPRLIYMILAKYTEGIAAMKIGMLAMLFQQIAAFMDQGLITYRKHLRMIVIIGGTIALYWSGSWIVIHNGLGLTAVACMYIAAMAFLYFSYAFACLRQAISSEEIIRFFILISAILSYYLGCYVVIEHLLHDQSIVNLFLRFIIFILISIPMILYGEKKFHTLQTSWNHLTKRGAVKQHPVNSDSPKGPMEGK